MLLKYFADVLQGHQITDEEIYYSLGDIPIYTGNNNIKGYWNKSLVDEGHLPCITYPTKGNPGVTFIQTKPFDANNTAAIFIKTEYKSKVRLEWLAYALRPLLKRHMTNVEGVSYLNKDLVDNIDIAIPDEGVQDKLIEHFKVIDNISRILREQLARIESLLAKTLSLDINDLPFTQLGEMLSYVSRNDSLSEEGLYGIEPDLTQPTIKVLSGSVDGGYYGYVPVSTIGIHFLDNRQALHLVTRGKAGKLTYLPKDRYATNTNAFLLYMKDGIKEKLTIGSEIDEAYYLKFLKLYLEPRFIEISSSSDVSVFPLTDVFDDMEIPKFQLNNSLRDIVDQYDQLETYRNKLKSQITIAEALLERGIVYD